MWGSESWGEMTWGGVAVPSLPLGMLILLLAGCFLAGGYFLRPERRNRRSYLVAALLVAIPLSVGAVTLPHVFVNGSIADANEVNANFAAITTALDAASCPPGMSRIDLPNSVLCYASGPLASWDNASDYCFDQFRARICNVQQWRDAICRAGVISPGASWTDSITGAGSMGVVSGCTGESISSMFYTTQRATPCCLERLRY